MSLSYTYDGAPLTHKVPPSLISIPQRAENGEKSLGKIPIEDPTATLVLLGHRPFIVAESACSQPRLFTGYVAQRDMGRSYEQTQWIGEDPRLFDTTIIDQNAIFGLRILWDADANRPEETWDARLAWILGSDYMAGLFGGDTTFIDSHPTTPMDAADYRGSTPGAVFDSLIQRFEGAMNYFAFWNPDTTDVEIAVFGITDTIGDCTLTISNVDADIDATTCFAPDMVAKLAREPDQVYSEVIVEYSGGRTVFRTLEETATTYIRRGTTISRPYTGKESTANAQGDQFLLSHALERDRITCVMQSVPAASVGLVQAGMGMDVKFSHLPGYETFTTMRIVACSPVPVTDIGDLYDITLELVGGIAPSVEVCPDPTPTGTWYPLGGSGNTSNPSPGDGNVMYYSGGQSCPTVPTPGYQGDWGFPNWGAGGIGTEDISGDCSLNNVRVAVTGPGTMTMHTVQHGGHACPLRAKLKTGTATISIINGPAGSDFVTVVPYSEICDWYVDITDDGTPHTCGGSWGFTGVDWVAGEAPTGDPVPGPVHPTTTTSTVDPSVDDDEAHGYQVGDHWVNTTDGSEWVLVDSTTGAAIWVSTTYVSLWNFSTSDGVTTVDPTVELTFVGATLADLGSGVAEVTVNVPALDLDDLGDVTITAADEGDVLTYDGAGWINAAPMASGELLITDTPAGSPLIFADILQNEAGTDLLYSD